MIRLNVIDHPLVTPAKAGVQGASDKAVAPWIPAFAGMTNGKADNLIG
jgi:hypothetical protein